MNDPDSVATQSLTVNAPVPTLSNLRVTDWSGTPTTPWVGDTVTLKADVSSFMGDWLTYSIAWGDGTPDTTGSLSTFAELSEQHAYNAAGVYSPTVTLTGAGGSMTHSLNVTVQAATFTVTALNPSTTQEPVSSMTPNTTPATFRITRNGGMSSGNIVHFTLSGTASPSDYTLATADPWNSWALTPPNGNTPGYIQFMMGPQTVDLTVTPTYGPEVEDDETVVLTLLDLSDPTYDISGNPSATITITDSPRPEFDVTVTKSATDAEGRLLEGSTLTLTIVASAPVDRYEIIWNHSLGGAPEIVYTDGQTWTTISHVYTDDDPTGSAVDLLDIRISAHQGTETYEVDPGTLLIANVAPTIPPITPSASSAFIDEFVSFTAEVTDPGLGYDAIHFSIDWRDGTVQSGTLSSSTLTGSHAYDTQGEYEPIVRLWDDDMAPQAANQFLFQVAVRNRKPTINPATFHIVENEPIGATNRIVRANDLDPADVLAYSIVGGNTGGKFAIDRNTGELSLVSMLDFEIKPNYALKVRVTDGTDSVDGDISIVVVNHTALSAEVLGQTIRDKARLMGAEKGTGPIIVTVGGFWYYPTPCHASHESLRGEWCFTS